MTIAGYRLSGEAARLFERVVRATPKDIQSVQREIDASGLEKRSKSELVGLMWDAANGKRLGSPSPAKREAAVNAILKVLDWRNERSRRQAWYVFGTLGGGRGSDR